MAEGEKWAVVVDARAELGLVGYAESTQTWRRMSYLSWGCGDCGVEEPAAVHR